MKRTSKKFLQGGLHILIFMVSAFIMPGCSSESSESDRPNVIIIFTDDMGYGDLGCFGSPNNATPHLDQMAEDGIRFTSFYVAAPVCGPSRAALATGRYPIRNMPFNTGPESTNGLPTDETTLADMLSAKGYATMAIGKWHMGHMPEYLPTSRGFDHFFGLPYSNDMILPWCPWLTEDDRLYMYEDTTQAYEVGFDQDDLTKKYTERALEFIEGSKDRPFFLYLAHSMPHLPIATSEEFRGKSAGGLYGDVIETIDWSTGQILTKLEELGLTKNTLVIFSSDNGPWVNMPDRMLQRGVKRSHAGSPGPLKGFKGTSLEGGFRVPGIMKWPAGIKPGQVYHEMAGTIDIYPTLASIVGAELRSDRTIDGKDISALFSGDRPVVRDDFYFVKGRNLEGYRRGNLKLRVTLNAGVELYDMTTDPRELINLADKFPEKVEEMYNMMEGFSSETGANLVSLEQLQALKTIE